MPKLPLAICCAALLCLTLAALPDSSALELNRKAVAAGQWWRLWTGHLVHFTPEQLLLDGGLLILVGLMAERELGSAFVACLLLLGSPMLALATLLVAPALAEYRGASRIVLMLAGALGAALWRRRPKMRAVLFLLVLGTLAKAGIDANGIGTDLAHLPGDVLVVWQAHLLGVCIGCLAAQMRTIARTPRRGG